MRVSLKASIDVKADLVSAVLPQPFAGTGDEDHPLTKAVAISLSDTTTGVVQQARMHPKAAPIGKHSRTLTHTNKHTHTHRT